MSFYLAKSRFNFTGQAAWKKDCLEGECLHHFRLILAHVNELTYEFICLRAATERSPHPLSDLFLLTAARPSRHLAKAHITVYSEKIAVRFEITEGVDEIDVTEISTGSGPSGGGGQSVTPPITSPSTLSLCNGRRGNEDVREDLYDRVAARAGTASDLRYTIFYTIFSLLAAFVARRLFVYAKPTSADRLNVLRQFVFRSAAKDIASSFTSKLPRIMKFNNQTHDHSNRGGKEFDSFARLSEALVQSAHFDGRQALETALTKKPCHEGWNYPSDINRVLKGVYSSDNTQSISRSRFGITIFYFGSDCLSAKDKDTIAIATTEKAGRAKIYIHSSDRALRQKNSVDLILAAAISNLRKQDVSNIFVECDGHVPFSERDDYTATDALSVWRRVFKIKHVLAAEGNSCSASNSHFEFILNDGAQKAITDYYTVACERFASGVNRDDVYVWRELAHWIGHDQNWSELSIVMRNLTKSDCDE